MKTRAPTCRQVPVDSYRVVPDSKVKLRKWATGVKKLYRSEADATAQLAAQVGRTSDLQDILYASDQHALLLIFQAMDAAGKDGAIKHVLSGVNPQGCHVTSFKQPSDGELDHDFLWRTALHLPERGRIGIFNRSYYEEVLVVRVHPHFLGAQKLPEECLKAKRFWEQRLESIRDHEAHLHRNGTVVVKFFLHVSRDEQRRRFLERIDHPDKNWKFRLGDVEERQYWDDYMSAYEKALSATSTKHSPWYIVPADDKKNARLIISQVVNETLESLQLRYPAPDRQRATELEAARKLLEE